MRRLVPIGCWSSLFVTLASCGGDDEAGSSTTTETQTETSPASPASARRPQPPPLHRRPPSRRPSRGGRDGVPAGGIVRESTDEGDRVVLLVTSDVADEVHLHGYDLSATSPRERREDRIPATIPGRFEVELEDRGVQIAELTVNP